MQVELTAAEGAKMNDSTSPMLLRRRLRADLRTARLKNNLTQEQVAKAMEWSLSKMNRIEQAKSGISANDLRALLALYGITNKEQVGELIDLARASRQTPWWRRRYGDVAPEGLLRLMDYESAASKVSQFEAMFVPGLLQTEEYASAVLPIFYDEKSSADRLAELRTARRNMLTSENAPEFAFVIDESVIHRVVGTPDVTERQLLHLVDISQLGNVTIQVVPFTASVHPGMKGSFKVVEFEDAPDESILFLESPRGDFISDDPGEALNYLVEFQHIQEKSLSPLRSADALRKAAAEMA
jgi:transcriptional regulator with XRE-family HTH domain